MKVLVDGDLVVFRAAFAAEKAHYTLRYEKQGRVIEHPFDTDRELKTFIAEAGITEYDRLRERRLEPVSHVYSNIRSLLGQIEKRTGEACPIIYLTGKGNFRRNITKTYKANRDPTMRPHYEEDARQFLKTRHNAYTVPGIEADDAIGLEMDDTAICVSLDKDLDMLPGQHYNWVQDRLYAVTPSEAHTHFYTQMLMGDRADNVAGIPGLGPKKAARLLANLSEQEQEKTVKALYKKAGLDYTMNYYLLRILQTPDDLHRALHYAANGTDVTLGETNEAT